MSDSLESDFITLVKGGANPKDAARTLSLTEIPEEWNEAIAQAEAHARTMIDTGAMKARPGETARRTPWVGGEEGNHKGRRRCRAKAKVSGERCKRTAIPGGTVCFYHGGAAPQVRSKAAQRVALLSVSDLLDRTNPEIVNEDLGTGMSRVIALDRQMVMALRALVGELDLDPGSDGFTGPDHQGDIKVHPLVDELRRWTDQLQKHQKLAWDAGLDERKVQITEDLAGVIASVIASVIADPAAGLSPPQRRRMNEVSAVHLRALPPALSQ